MQGNTPLYNHSVALSLGGAAVANIQTTELTESSSEEDATVVEDQGAYDFVGDVKTYAFQFQALVNPDAPLALRTGQDYETSSWGHTGFESVAGKVQLLEIRRTGGNKGLVQYSGSGKFRAAVTRA